MLTPLPAFFLLCIVLAFLRSRLHYVSKGKFGVKKRWLIKSKYYIVDEGRRFIIPFIESILRDKGSGRIIEFTKDQNQSHTLKSIECVSSDNMKILASLSFEYNIKNPALFLDTYTGKLLQEEGESLHSVDEKMKGIVVESFQQIAIGNANLKKLKDTSNESVAKICRSRNLMEIQISSIEVKEVNMVLQSEDYMGTHRLVTAYLKTYSETDCRQQLEARNPSVIQPLIDLLKTNNNGANVNFTFNIQPNN